MEKICRVMSCAPTLTSRSNLNFYKYSAGQMASALGFRASKNCSTSAMSRVRFIGGKLCLMRFIAFRNQTRVANHQHAAIGFIANQTPGALLQGDDRLG